MILMRNKKMKKIKFLRLLISYTIFIQFQKNLHTYSLNQKKKKKKRISSFSHLFSQIEISHRDLLD